MAERLGEFECLCKPEMQVGEFQSTLCKPSDFLEPKCQDKANRVHVYMYWWFAFSMLSKLFACTNNIRKLTSYRAGRNKRSVQIIAL